MKRWLSITKESAFGTASVTPADKIWVFLSGANSFKHMTTPQYWSLMTGMGYAVPWASGCETIGVGASLSVPLTATQAPFLLPWAFQRIAAGSVPWATTEPAGDLASCRLEYFWTTFDGVVKSKAWTGCKVASATLGGSDQDRAPLSLQLQLIGSTPQGNPYDESSDPAVAQPLPTVYPKDYLLFQHLRGGLSIGAVGVRTNWKSFSVELQNRLTPYFDEYRYANAIRLGGRAATLKSRLRLKNTTDDRAVWESGGVMAASAELNDGSKKIKFDFRSQNVVDSMGEDFPEDGEVYYDLAIKNQFDPAATAGDFALSISDVE